MQARIISLDSELIGYSTVAQTSQGTGPGFARRDGKLLTREGRTHTRARGTTVRWGNSAWPWEGGEAASWQRQAVEARR